MVILQEVFRIHYQTHHPDAELQQIESDAALWSAIRRLIDLQREAIVLRYYHDLPIANISQVTGVSERTVHNRLRAAHERLLYTSPAALSAREQAGLADHLSRCPE